MYDVKQHYNDSNSNNDNDNNNTGYNKWSRRFLSQSSS